ncbi:purine-cytosine permease [Xylaria bambusicola]|uniref:purine-cytosine permease n=1 Tax=Xylaria bambusicola TaxID=326684 RepID=UPI0020081C01|nr:purine-cytosine permease [Xylaria bambusicola]KAI0506886.1 purine-cytosine permease [Xylaria bambusicola]
MAHAEEKPIRWEPTGIDVEVGQAGDIEAVSSDMPTEDNSFHAKLQAFAGRYGIEQRGIERVPDDEKTDSSMSQIGTLWLSANMVVSSFAIGVLAIPVFNLSYLDSALTIIFVNILGVMPVCFFSTFGARFGLRQMVLSRFYFGYYGVKFVACFNILSCIGWSAVNVIVGAQLLHAINHDVPGYAGILIIALSTLIICAFGYRLVHVYEHWSWIPSFIIFLIVLGTFARSGNFNARLPLATGPAEAGAVLSFAASIFGFATGWTSVAADYTVYQPGGKSRALVFFWTLAGLLFPLIFTELLGAAVATGISATPAYDEAYSDSGIGGLLAQVLVPPLGRFGELCVVILALSIIANNCPNIYSVSLSLQVLAYSTERVPRFIWTAVGTAVYIAVAVPGYEQFEAALENVLLLTSYWLAIYQGVSLTEHFVFRRGFKGYRPDDYMIPKKLPPGIAATLAFVVGVVGAVLGTAQTWYTGPIGKLCGTDFGGDVGFELAFSFTSITYIGLRSVERRYFGR